MIEKIKTEWNLGLLFKNEKEIELEKKKCMDSFSKFVTKWKNRNDYLENPKIMKEALDEYELLMRNHGFFGKASLYYFLKSDIDSNNPDLKAQYNKVKEISNNLINDIQFFTLGISKISKDKQKMFLESTELKNYRHFIQRAFDEARYLLSEKEERILNLKHETSHQKWEDMLESFLSKSEENSRDEHGEEKKRSFAELQGLLDSKDKQVRDSAAKSFNIVLAQQSDVAEVEINAILANKKVDDELRNMDRPDLQRFLDDDVDYEIVDTLTSTVTKRFDIASRFYKLKARLMNVGKLQYHERNVPYGKIENNYDFDKSVKIVKSVFKNLDSEFESIFDRMIKNGQVDVFPRKNKRDGGYCCSELITTPTFILLNHNNSLSDVTVLAHEFGHAINSELMKEKLNSLSIDTPKSTAEVASIFMEDFVFRELMKEADDELRLSILISKLKGEINLVIRQTALYNFETQLHKEFRLKGYLSKEEIGKIFLENMAAYMGDAVERSPGSENWWIYVPHIRYMFYVYSYSMGNLISKALQREVRKDHKFIEKVKEFLSSGISESPKNLFLKLGIDITKEEFWNAGIDEIEALLNEAEALAKKLGKI